jgi:hypothetical protein
MNSKNIIISLVLVCVAFYGGMLYGKKTISPNTQANGQFTRSGNGQRGVGGRFGMNGGFISGQMISKDEKSVNIKTQDGSTRIVLLASSTQVMKSTVGSQTDLNIGENISVNGVANSDGSITAQNIQIRQAQR